MAKEQGPSFNLEIRAPGKAAHRVPIGERLTVGKSEDNDLPLDGIGIAPVHCVFKTQNNLLSVHHMAPGYNIYLEKQELGAGKMYILDKGDKLRVGDHELVIRKEEVVTSKKKSSKAHDEEAEEEEEEEQEEEKKAPPKKKTKQEKEEEEEAANKTSVASLIQKAEDGEEEDEESEEETDEEEEESPKKEKGPGLFARLFKKKTKEKAKAVASDDDDDDDDDDDEEEVKPKKKSKNKKAGLFARLFKRDPRKIKIKKKINLKSYAVPPGLAARVWSLLLDAALVYAVIHFAIPFLELEEMRDQASTIVGPEIKHTVEDVTALVRKLSTEHQIPVPPEIWDEIPRATAFILRTDILVPALVFMALQLFFHILTGTSLGLYLMGAASDSTFITNRLKAIFRCLIGFVTLPFLIFDFPIVLRKRTFKEFVTFSDLEFKNRGRKVLGAILPIPLLMVACVLSPAFFAMELLEGVPVTEVRMPQGTPKVSPTDTPLEGYLKSIGVKVKWNLPAGSVIWFQVDSDRKWQVLSLVIYDPEKKAQIRLTWNNRPNLKALYKLMPIGDPLFPYLHPAADAFLESGATVPNPEAAKDLVAVAKAAMSLGTETIPMHLIEHGPFINGQAIFRRDLFKELGVWPVPKDVELFKLAGRDYLSLSSSEPPQDRRILLNLELSPPKGLHLDFIFKTRDASWARGLIQKLIRGVQAESEGGQETENFKAGRLLSFLGQGDALTPQDEAWLKQHTMAIAKLTLAQQERSLSNSLATKLKREAALFTKLKEIGNTAQLVRFATDWQKMEKAVEAQDQTFFNAR